MPNLINQNSTFLGDFQTLRKIRKTRRNSIWKREENEINFIDETIEFSEQNKKKIYFVKIRDYVS